MHVAMVVHQYNMAEEHYLFENLNRPSNVGLTRTDTALTSIKFIKFIK